MGLIAFAGLLNPRASWHDVVVVPTRMPPVPPDTTPSPGTKQVGLSYDASFGKASESCVHPPKYVTGPQVSERSGAIS